jgi:16S rRNA (guanine966-N2)-methyltransferase
MRIVAGAWRGRTLVAPAGPATRPTADRVRQALFDMLMHAEWGGRALVEGAVVLDVFAGTGALGLEALSRGAASACFIENDPAALRALRANIAACGVGDRAVVLAVDALTIGNIVDERRTPSTKDPGSPGGGYGAFPTLVFLDPPYGQNLVPRALSRLRDVRLIRPGALVVAETGREERWAPEQSMLAERQHGAARILIFRTADPANAGIS